VLAENLSNDPMLQSASIATDKWMGLTSEGENDYCRFEVRPVHAVEATPMRLCLAKLPAFEG
jgi:hypothetical protein